MAIFVVVGDKLVIGASDGLFSISKYVYYTDVLSSTSRSYNICLLRIRLWKVLNLSLK